MRGYVLACPKAGIDTTRNGINRRSDFARDSHFIVVRDLRIWISKADRGVDPSRSRPVRYTYAILLISGNDVLPGNTLADQAPLDNQVSRCAPDPAKPGRSPRDLDRIDPKEFRFLSRANEPHL